MSFSHHTWFSICQARAAGALLMLICLPALVYAGLQLARWQVKRSAKERLETSQVHVLQVPANQVTWEKAGKEIRWQGRLFDIKTLRQEGDLLILTGLYDEEEEAIEAAAAKLAGHTAKGEKTIALWVMAAFSGQQASLLAQLPSFCIVPIHKPFCAGRLLAGYDMVPSPPPNFLAKA